MGGRLEGRVAIVTGAGSGLGRASAVRFAQEGAAVACVDLHEASAEETAAVIGAGGGRAIALRADVAQDDDADAMGAATVKAFGRIDVLYANAGVEGTGTAMDTTRETWDRVIAVNLTGVWLSLRAVLPRMVEQGSGSIITQASVGGLVGVRGIAPYAAAKAGVIGLTRQAAVDFGADNVRVNAIAPGTVPTPLVSATYAQRGGLTATAADDPEEALRKAATRYPLGRLGTVDEVANMALFLASDEAAWITGAVFVVDGGLTAT